MGGKRKKARAADQDEMLGPSSPTMLGRHQPSTSAAAQQNHPGFVARSWARISGRRRRQKRRMLEMEERRQERLATTLTTLEPMNGFGNGQQQQSAAGWPTMDRGMETGGQANLAGLAHLEEEEERRKRHFLGRGMDRLRRSIRRSLHKGSQSGQVLTNSSADGQPSSSNGQSNRLSKNYCHSDEIAVRSAACSFPVKYLGACEVFESRGMSVCESALQHLRTRKRTVKALLYVSGDGIRVVDQENNRGLIVDQTIEKVSFCSPDRHNDKGFAYVCRDGATRRWMCHGFHAAKDSGERLSHAVGCAFTVCLEKKRKRDAETAAYKSAQALANSLNKEETLGNFQNEQQRFMANPTEGIFNEEFARTNQAYRSFRQLSISERRADPQKAILVGQIRPQLSLDSPNNSSVIAQIPSGLAATPRPTANPALFERTGSLRAPILPSSTNASSMGSKSALSINRFNSLQFGNNSDSRTNLPRMSLHNEPIWEGEDWKEGSSPNEQNNSHWPTTGSNRFYRTLPHSMPNFGQAGGINNSWSLANVIPPPTIPEEDKQQQQQTPQPLEMDNNSSPPADPFTFNDRNNIEPQKFWADNWLEQTIQRAASSSAATLPRSATMNWPPQTNQQNWAQFPQSQSSQAVTDRPNGGLISGSNYSMAHSSLSCWVNPNLPNFDQNPGLATTLRMPKQTTNSQSPLEKKDHDETDQSIATKNHSRKASGNRRIEYQLLKETDVSVSPPKNQSVLGRAIGSSNGNGQNDGIDPFDVNWSQRVLAETAKQHQNGKKNNGEGEEDKFGWDLSSPPVNV